MLKSSLVHLIFLLQKPAGTCAAIVLLLSLSSSLTEPVTPVKAFTSSLMQQPQILQPLRHMVFPSVLMVFSLHFVFGQGSFLLRNKFRLPFAEKHFPSLINNAAANPQLPSHCIFSIHSVWVCGMMIFSLPDIFSPSSCSLLLQKFPQNYSPHWTMLISSPSPGEKTGVWSLVTQPRIQAETQCVCGDHVGLALKESVKVGLSSSSAVFYHSCLSGCVPAHLLAM